VTATLSERPVKPAHPDGRSLNDIREERPLSANAQQFRERAAAISRLRERPHYGIWEAK